MSEGINKKFQWNKCNKIRENAERSQRRRILKERTKIE